MSFKIRDFEVGPGEKKHGYIDVAETPTKMVQLPVMVVNGRESGSKLCLIAGTHSMEYEGIEAVVRLYHAIDPVNLKGTLAMCPILNMPGFEQGVPYLNPLDGKNMNRVYPGKSDGTISEKIVYVAFNEIIRPCDYHIDFHGGDYVEDHAQCVLYDTGVGTKEVDEKEIKMAQYFQPGVIREFKGGWPNTSSTEVAKIGIPSLTTEAGALGAYREEDVLYHFNGTINLMKWLKMLSEPPEEPKDIKIATKTESVKVTKGGVFYPYLKIGDTFKKGDLLAEVKDIFGMVIEQLYAPMDGTASIIYPKRVKVAGDPAFSVWGFD